MLQELRNRLDLNSPFDAAVFIAALIAFWCQCRLGELLGTSRQHHSPSHFPSRNSIGSPFSELGSREILLPRTKTRQHSGDKVTLLRQSAPLDPIEALENHFRINSNIPANHHLFAFEANLRSGKVIRCLTKEAFLDRCNEIWSAIGFPKITGHCFRIGGTTELLLRGLSPDLVRKMGRWSSDAHLRYWRQTNLLAADQAELLQERSHQKESRAAAPAGPLRTRPTARRGSAKGRPY